jgi:hypothetical protein
MAMNEGSASAEAGRIQRLRQITTQVEFGQELTLLRDRANLSVREASATAGLPYTTAGGYFAGTHLPTPKLLAAQFPKLLHGLGVHDEIEVWTDAVRRIRRLARQKTVTRLEAQPYRGLARFEPEDAPWFFGRNELTEMLLEALPAAAGQRRAAVRDRCLRSRKVLGAQGRADPGAARTEAWRCAPRDAILMLRSPKPWHARGRR